MNICINIDTIHLDCHCRKPAGGFRWHVGLVTQKGRVAMPLDIALTTEQKVLITATPTTAGGQPAMLDGPVVYTVESGECTVTAVDDFSTYIVSGANPGDSIIMVTADADLGEGIQHIQDAITVHVAHALASNLGLKAGQPELK